MKGDKNPPVRTPGNLSAIPPKPNSSGTKMPTPNNSPAGPRGPMTNPTQTKGT